MTRLILFLALAALAALSTVPMLLQAGADDRAQLVYWGGYVSIDGRGFNKPWVQISLGQDHAVGLKTDGTVAAWGSNYSGQTDVPDGLSDVKAVAAGRYHSMALKNDGTVIAWGDNGVGQVTMPAGLTGVKAIAAGWQHNLALKNDGTVVAWGDTGENRIDVPEGLVNVTAIAAGQAHSVALLANGAVVVWGVPVYGLLNVPPAALSGVKAIACGDNHILALKTDGTVIAWGINDYGQKNVPAGLPAVKAIAAGGNHSVALRTDGSVTGWGKNDSGQTIPSGEGSVTSITAGYSATLTQKLDGTFTTWGRHYPGFSNEVMAIVGKTVLKNDGKVMVLGDGLAPPAYLLDNSTVTAIASGLDAYHVVALRSDGTVAAWGDNSYGQTTVPGGLGPVKAVAAGRFHTVVLQTNGAIVAWGGNDSGQATVPAAALSDIKAIAAGSSHTVALRNNGTVVAWGSDNYGESQVPMGLSDVQAIAAGEAHTVVLKTDGTVVTWGNNDYGQIMTPDGLAGVKAITAGAYHTAALKTDGSVVAWGRNEEGQLNVPVGLTGAATITAGRDYTATITPLAASSPKPPTVQISDTGSGLVAVVQGIGPIAYQWRKNGQPIGGAIKSTLNLTSSQYLQDATYDVVVKNTYGVTLSLPYITSSSPRVSVFWPPQSVRVNLGQTAFFHVATFGPIPTGVTRQWYKDGVAIKGATGYSLNIPNVNINSVGRYSVSFIASTGKPLSYPAYLTLNDDRLLIYKLTGTGTSYQGITATTGAITGFMILDRTKQRGGFIFGRKDGNQNIHSLELHNDLKTRSTGPVPKTQTVISEAAAGEPIIWLNGTDSLLTISKTDQTFGPATFKGFMNHSNASSTDAQITHYVETMNLSLTLDTVNSAPARLNQESVEQALQRLSKSLQLKGSVLIE